MKIPVGEDRFAELGGRGVGVDASQFGDFEFLEGDLANLEELCPHRISIHQQSKSDFDSHRTQNTTQ